MRAAALPAGTKPAILVARAAATFCDLLRAARARANAHRTQTWEYVRNVAKRNLSSVRGAALVQTTALAVDLGQRSEHPENAEQPFLYLAAVARSAWAESHPGTRATHLSRDEARIAEQIAQGEAENAEKRYDLDESVTNAHALLDASARYVAAVRARDEAIRRDLAFRST